MGLTKQDLTNQIQALEMRTGICVLNSGAATRVMSAFPSMAAIRAHINQHLLALINDILDSSNLFAQLDSALNRQFGGTGLGLALVRRLAELHGGHIDAEV